MNNYYREREKNSLYSYEDLKTLVKKHNFISTNNIKCKCSHTMVIPKGETKILCDWCGKYIFINQKEEFKYRLMEKLKCMKN